jgi:hypothetical protein
MLERQEGGEFFCSGHHALFLPALLRGSSFWGRVHEGLQLFGVPPENLTAVTGFRLDMVQRPRFTAQLYPTTATAPGTFGFLLGDAANAIHFWPGRGLNSGLASVISLARCLATTWRGTVLRDADFVRHEAVMAMLQYRLEERIDGLPDDATLRDHLERLPGQLVHTLLISDAWDTRNVGGEEVDVEWLLKPATAAGLT